MKGGRNMDTLKIYKEGEIIAILKDVKGLLLKSSGSLEVIAGDACINYEKKEFDYFYIL